MQRLFSLKQIVDGQAYWMAKNRFKHLDSAIERAEKLHGETSHRIEIYEFVIGEGDKLVRVIE